MFNLVVSHKDTEWERRKYYIFLLTNLFIELFRCSSRQLVWKGHILLLANYPRTKHSSFHSNHCRLCIGQQTPYTIQTISVIFTWLEFLRRYCWPPNFLITLIWVRSKHIDISKAHWWNKRRNISEHWNLSRRRRCTYFWNHHSYYNASPTQNSFCDYCCLLIVKFKSNIKKKTKFIWYRANENSRYRFAKMATASHSLAGNCVTS